MASQYSHSVLGSVLGIILTWLALVLPAMTAHSENLPRMGEPVDQTLSPQQESIIGRQFMRQARSQLPLIEDPQLTEFIQQLGERLLTGMAGVEHRYTFFLIDDNSINAFAVPGGYIAVNSGLIKNFRNESQVAAVVAHEIAHVTQRHHARAYSTQGNSALTTAAAILAAIVLSQHSADASQAALATGIAASQQSRINYTRANEYEADRIGIEILANAGYAASGMADAFNILRRKSSLNTSANQVEYLRTHPLGDNRIAEAKNRAAATGNNGDRDSLSFRLFRTRLAVLTAHDLSYLSKLFLADQSTRASTEAEFGLALIAAENRNYNAALEHTENLLDAGTDEFDVRLLYSELLYHNGHQQDSMDEFSNLIDLHPTRYSPIKSLSGLLIDSGDYLEAYDKLIRYERRNSRVNPDVYRQLANVQQKRQKKTSSHDYLATYYEKMDEPTLAVKQLELALQSATENSQAKMRITSRLKSLRESTRLNR